MISACLLAAALVFSPEDAKAAFALTDSFVRECTPRDAGTVRGRFAAMWLLGKASSLGGNVYRDEFTAAAPGGTKHFVNLYCPFERRKGAPWTVFVSHFDTKPGTECPGANDGAATSCLQVQLVKTIFDNRDFDKNVMFVWTDGEECVGEHYAKDDGFQGSVRAAAMLKEKKYNVDAVYVLDMIADKDLKLSFPKNGSLELAKRVVRSAKRCGFKRQQIGRIDQRVLDDHIAFLDAGFEAVDLIDFCYGSKPGLNDYWHTSEDTVDKLSTNTLHTVGRLVCEILNTESK